MNSTVPDMSTPELQRFLSGNPVTGQGDRDYDAATHLSIHDLLTTYSSGFDLQDVSAFISGHDLAYRIASEVPTRMGDVGFSLSTSGLMSDSDRQILQSINDQLLALRPWLVAAQIAANCAGRSWLILDTQTDNGLSAPSVPPMMGAAGFGTGVGATEEDVQESRAIASRLPLAFPLDWQGDWQQITPHAVVDESSHHLTREQTYLYCRRGDLSSFLRQNYELQQQMQNQPISASSNGLPLNVVTDGQTIRQYLRDRASRAGSLNDLQCELVDGTRIIPFFGLGYRQRTAYTEIEQRLMSRDTSYRPRLHSWSALRSIPAILQLESAINNILNRGSRAESVVIRTPDLGDRNLDIARHSAERTTSTPGAVLPTTNSPVEIVMSNLKRMRHSLRSSGILEIDGEQKIDILSRSLANSDDYVNIWWDRLLSSANLPEIVLLNRRRNSGLSNGSDGDRREMADRVDSAFSDHFAPTITHLAQSLASRYPSLRGRINEISVTAQSAYHLTESEHAELLDTVSQSVERLVRAGALQGEQAQALMRQHPTLGAMFRDLPTSVTAGPISVTRQGDGNYPPVRRVSARELNRRRRLDGTWERISNGGAISVRG